MQEFDQQLSLAVGKQTFYLGGVGSSLTCYFEARSTNPCLSSKSRDAVPGRYAEGTAAEDNGVGGVLGMKSLLFR
jgi:hypothetical protein